MAFVHLNMMPAPPRTRTIEISSLRGGLNIHDTPWQIRGNQTPEARNVWWEDGALRSRPDVTAYNNGLVNPKGDVEPESVPGIRSSGLAFNGWYVIYNPTRKCFTAIPEERPENYVDVAGPEVAQAGGSFFTHSGDLYYKAKGGYYRIKATEEMNPDYNIPVLAAEVVEPFVPTTYINAVPSIEAAGETQFGGGDFYQSYNRLSYKRRITYNIKPETKKVVVPEKAVPETLVLGILQKDGSYAPLTGYTTEITAKGTILSFAGTELTDALTTAGTLTFTNNAEISYEVPKEGGNLIQYESIMGCDIATVYGGRSAMFVVLAGYEGQPNAYFWSGNTNLSVDPSYFPAEFYNLCGDASDPIVAFGKQQSMLIILQTRQVGRAVYDKVTVDKRIMVEMPYTTINPYIGCDFPHSVQLVENNLVWANRVQGVVFLRDTSPANENNVVPISRNIERPRTQIGLLNDLAQGDAKDLQSFDDGQRYWLCVNDHVWLWDYSQGGSVREPLELSWFYWDNFSTPSCWLEAENDFPAYIGKDGYLRRFQLTSVDVIDPETKRWAEKGADFEKRLTLPVLDFYNVENLKDVVKAIFVMNGNGNNIVDLEYETDWETRRDLTPIYIPGKSVWIPRNLTYRSLRIVTFATTAIRKPRTIHIRHFKARLLNEKRGDQIAFVSAKILYNLQGEDR